MDSHFPTPRVSYTANPRSTCKSCCRFLTYNTKVHKKVSTQLSESNLSLTKCFYTHRHIYHIHKRSIKTYRNVIRIINVLLKVNILFLFLVLFNGSLTCDRTLWSPTKRQELIVIERMATGRSMSLSHMSSNKRPQSAMNSFWTAYFGGGTSPYLTISFHLWLTWFISSFETFNFRK